MDLRLKDKVFILTGATRGLARATADELDAAGGEPAEFARAAAFLLTPAPSFVSGVMLPVDGGMLRTL